MYGGFHKSYSGFSVVELLIVGLIIVFIGSAFAFSHKVDRQKTASSTSLATTKSSTTTSTTKPLSISTGPPQGSSPPSAVTSTPSSTTPATSADTISVTPIGITITVPTSLSDLTYKTSTNASGLTTVSFSTTSLTQAVSACSASNGNGAFDTIIRGSGNYPGPEHPSSGALISQQPSYYIAYELPTGPCATNLSSTTQSLLDEQAQDFYSAISTIQVTT
jgi:cytoskeletal protein RodZ